MDNLFSEIIHKITTLVERVLKMNKVGFEYVHAIDLRGYTSIFHRFLFSSNNSNSYIYTSSIRFRFG